MIVDMNIAIWLHLAECKANVNISCSWIVTHVTKCLGNLCNLTCPKD